MAPLLTAFHRKDEEEQQSEAIKEFRKGVVQLQRGMTNEALESFRNASALEPRNAYFLSYYGLTLGLARRRWEDAEALCTDALKLKRTVPQLYLNLADVYRRSGRRADAIETLKNGMNFTGKDGRISDALTRFGLRRPPVLPFLSRENALNKYLGKMRHSAVGLLSHER
jgi:Flp pilus assembly protein TadD